MLLQVGLDPGTRITASTNYHRIESLRSSPVQASLSEALSISSGRQMATSSSRLTSVVYFPQPFSLNPALVGMA